MKPLESYFEQELNKLNKAADFERHLDLLRIIFRFKDGEERAHKVARLVEKTKNEAYLTQMLAYCLKAACAPSSSVLLDHGVDPNQHCSLTNALMLNITDSRRCEKLLVEYGAVVTADVLQHKTLGLAEALKKNAYFESTFSAVDKKDKANIDGHHFLLNQFIHQNHGSDAAKEKVHQQLHLLVQNKAPSQYELSMFSALDCSLSYNPSEDHMPIWGYAIMNTNQPERLALLMEAMRNELDAQHMPYVIEAIREDLTLKKAEGILSTESIYSIQQILMPYLLEKSLLHTIHQPNTLVKPKPQQPGMDRF